MFGKKKEQPQGQGITVQTGVVANALTTEALISVLIRKNICTKDEILAEIKVISDATRAKSQQPR
jgi:hypothetical protein